jgi:hypothetical protein
MLLLLQGNHLYHFFSNKLLSLHNKYMESKPYHECCPNYYLYSSKGVLLAILRPNNERFHLPSFYLLLTVKYDNMLSSLDITFLYLRVFA